MATWALKEVVAGFQAAAESSGRWKKATRLDIRSVGVVFLRCDEHRKESE